MRNDTFYILTQPDDTTPKPYISFYRFIAYVQNKIHTESEFVAKFYKTVLSCLLAYTGIAKPIAADELQSYKDIYEVLKICLFPTLGNEETSLWSMSAPDVDYVFYSTSAFYNLLSPFSVGSMFSQANEEEIKAFYDSMCEIKYALILEQMFSLQPQIKKEIIYVWMDKTSGLPTYFNIDVDNRFVEVKQTTLLNNADTPAIKKYLKDINSLCELEDLLPMSAFAFEGFSIVTASDITAKHALHKMRNIIIHHEPQEPDGAYLQIIYLLKAMCGTADIDFGLLPLLKLDGEIVMFYYNYSHSIMINIARQQRLKKEFLLPLLKEYAENPQTVFFNSKETFETKNKTLIKALQKAGIEDYILLPVYQNNQLTGLLEVSTKQENVLNKDILPKLEAALPVLAQLMLINQNEFSSAIDKIVSMNFTSVQPSVEWKFNETAFNHMETYFESGDINTSITKPIRFENVYPLYGAIDIRNSTIEKNTALYKDMQFYFSFLLRTLLSLNNNEESLIFDLTDEVTELQHQSAFELVNNEAATVKLIKKANEFFLRLTETHPQHITIINNYFDAVKPETGIVNRHRHALESSMKIVNTALNKHLDKMQAEYQSIYPVYFDKFRTDGVEYDIYVGQSISPKQPYKEDYLQQLRLIQLRSMATAVKLVGNCIATMPLPLQTTQLIYVNANAIDISFRPDEKRFDVEGAYNTRYHIVKKRIDKVYIKNTNKRLTQPDKIAIVYSQQEHADEYKQHIIQLHQEGILHEQMEELELEELQGVTGLHALRVSVPQ